MTYILFIFQTLSVLKKYVWNCPSIEKTAPMRKGNCKLLSSGLLLLMFFLFGSITPVDEHCNYLF